jgi:hypothetical protein
MPLNAEGLDAEFVKNIVEAVNAGGKKSTDEEGKPISYTREDIAVRKNDKNEWEAYPKDKTIDKKYIIATIPATTLGWKAQPSVREKRVLVSQEKGKTSQAKAKKGGAAFDDLGKK